MLWPPYSPDLNPIESHWKMLKAKIDRVLPELKGMGNSQATMDLLIECAQEGPLSELSKKASPELLFIMQIEYTL